MYLFLDTAILRDEMRKSMISKDDLVKLSGVSGGTMTRIFSGRYARVQIMSLQAMAEAVGVKAENLTASAEDLQNRKAVLTGRIEKNEESRKQIHRYERELKRIDTLLNASGF